MRREDVFTITNVRKQVDTSMGKFTKEERIVVKALVATLSIKRIPDNEIINEIYRQTNKRIGTKAIYELRQSIKKESYHWYKTMREGQYEYIHEFKERINEILSLQKLHHQIIDSPTEPTTIKQSSLAELHRLNITLSNYFDVAPDIINGSTLSAPSEAKAITTSIIV
jgi:uncharacterized membrane protein YgaE (UPF0421/DUF939 family)